MTQQMIDLGIGSRGAAPGAANMQPTEAVAFSRGRQSLDRSVWYNGWLMTFLATGEETQGQFAFFNCSRGSSCYDGEVQTVFEAAGGIDGLRGLAGAWHRRVMADEVVAHAFSYDFHPQHLERLAAYWAEALGGPTIYSDSLGNETTVVKIHSGNGGTR